MSYHDEKRVKLIEIILMIELQIYTKLYNVYWLTIFSYVQVKPCI